MATKMILFIGIAIFMQAGLAQAARIKDLVNVRGVRDNHLIGFGLVVGLKGTGDTKKSLTTNRAVANMLTRLGMNTAAAEVAGGNIAAVVATAELPAFSRIGDRLDVKVSTVGDAKSLAGGTLLLTPLKAGDSQVYAVGQGAVVVGDARDSGPQVLTVARVPQGLTVEREFAPTIMSDGRITLSLRQPDFTTAVRVASVINKQFKGFFAQAHDLTGISVEVPILYQEKIVEFVAKIEALTVEADRRASVVINERTGTVVMGSDVTIAPVTVSHGDLTISVKGNRNAAEKSVVNFEGATVGGLIETMNAMGVKPEDLIGILQAIHAAGAMAADIQFL